MQDREISFGNLEKTSSDCKSQIAAKHFDWGFASSHLAQSVIMAFLILTVSKEHF